MNYVSNRAQGNIILCGFCLRFPAAMGSEWAGVGNKGSRERVRMEGAKIEFA